MVIKEGEFDFDLNGLDIAEREVSDKNELKNAMVFQI